MSFILGKNDKCEGACGMLYRRGCIIYTIHIVHMFRKSFKSHIALLRRRTRDLRSGVPALARGKTASASKFPNMNEMERTPADLTGADGRKDRLSPEERSALMAKVKSCGTKPEEKVRKALFKEGFRYRKNVPKLPGKPDIVLPKYKAIVFVHGCFWHQHENCPESVLPQSRREYWGPKLRRNVQRDQGNAERLQQNGWRVFIVWECELRPRWFQNTMDALIKKLRELAPIPE